MAIADFGPFENDTALDFLEEFIDVESPAGSVRAALAMLRDDRYHDVDEACTAWAACELVAIAVSEGEGHDPEEFAYECAARLRPNKKLIAECLGALPRVLDEQSELTELVSPEHYEAVKANVASTRKRLVRGQKQDKIKRLRLPKFKSVPAIAIPVAGKWMAALEFYGELQVFTAVYDEQPEGLPEDSRDTLLRCRLLADPATISRPIGRVKLDGELAAPYVYVTKTGWSCLSASHYGTFETSYFLHRGEKFQQVDYTEAKQHPYCANVDEAELIELLSYYVKTGELNYRSVPTPDELRESFLRGCKDEWAQYLAGDGGGPFSFEQVFRFDVAPYLQHWISLMLRTNWHNKGMCLPDDLMKYFLVGVVATCVGAFPQERVPERLRPAVEKVKPHVGIANIPGAMHVLRCLLDEASVIPRILEENPPRREAFLAEANALLRAFESVS